MNDPGLHDAIDANAKKVEREIQQEEQVEENDEQTFLNPRYSSPQNNSHSDGCTGAIQLY